MSETTTTTDPRQLPQEWRDRAQGLRALGHEPSARAFERAADDLEDCHNARTTEPLTLKEAAEYSGLSYAHLSRCISNGTYPNAGIKGNPRVLRGYLPRAPVLQRKPTGLAAEILGESGT